MPPSLRPAPWPHLQAQRSSSRSGGPQRRARHRRARRRRRPRAAPPRPSLARATGAAWSRWRRTPAPRRCRSARRRPPSCRGAGARCNSGRRRLGTRAERSCARIKLLTACSSRVAPGRPPPAPPPRAVSTQVAPRTAPPAAVRHPPSARPLPPRPLVPVALEGADGGCHVAQVVQIDRVVGRPHRQLRAGAGAPAHRAHVGRRVELRGGGGYGCSGGCAQDGGPWWGPSQAIAMA